MIMGGRFFFTKIITPKQANPRNQPRIDSSVVVVGSWKSDLWGEFCGFKTDSTMKKWPPEKKTYSSIVPQLDPWDGNLYPAIFPLFMWPFFTFHVGKWSISGLQGTITYPLGKGKSSTQKWWLGWDRLTSHDVTLPETNSSHLKIGHLKRKLVFQPSIWDGISGHFIINP